MLFALFCLHSCSQGDSDQLGGLIEGIVIDDSNNSRIEGIAVTVYEDCATYIEENNNTALVVGRDFTADDGSFRVELPELTFEDLCLRINSSPIDENFSTGLFYIASGNEYYKEVRLTHYTGLKVIAQLGFSSFVTDLELAIPGESCTCNDLTTNRALGNRYNHVEWKVTTPEGYFIRQDSIYCPVGELTEYIIQL